MVGTITVIGLVGTGGVLVGVGLLAREGNALVATDSGGDDAVGTHDTAVRVLVGVTLLVAGAALVYVALALGGVLAPW